MTNENFRNELGHVFDDVAGSPSAALPDRVRSSPMNAAWRGASAGGRY